MSSKRPNYFERHSDSTLDRLKEIVELQWGVLNSHIHLIASACYPFPSVLRSLSEPSFVFPAEGMPGARYLPGAEIMDIVEIEGEQLALDLFGSPIGYRATLQPHSGTQANQIVYNAVLEPGDKVLCLSPKDGGHISHTVLLSRRHESIKYGLTSSGLIDYDELRVLSLKEKPKLIIVGGSSLPREIDFKICKTIAKDSGAILHADISHTATFIAAGLHQTVFPYCDFVTFNTVKNLRGPNAGILIYRNEFSDRVHSSIFPVTQGGANETNMLGKFAALSEWKRRDIHEYALDILHAARMLSTVFTNRNIRLTTGGTDCHILLIELGDKCNSGAELEKKFEKMGILINKNLIPGDKRSPSLTSGLRIGTTNLAILGYSDEDLLLLGGLISDVIEHGDGDNTIVDVLVDKYNKGVFN